MILLPSSAIGWDIETLRVVVLHELAYARRRDNLVNLLQHAPELKSQRRSTSNFKSEEPWPK
jgi:beta-lactamase regulating signal transducer with metallopeptidase domain